jgi:uncharacterized protein with ACT and thioredoxin-like domain
MLIFADDADPSIEMGQPAIRRHQVLTGRTSMTVIPVSGEPQPQEAVRYVIGL